MIGNGVEFDPVQARNSADRLDALADRLDASLRTNHPAVFVEPAAVDEVSIRAARTLNGVAVEYHTSAMRGVEELRKLAATLRFQSRHLSGTEAASAASFGLAI
jgi:hypothetical protein